MSHVVEGRNYFHEGDYQAAGFYGLPPGNSTGPGYRAFIGSYITNFNFDWSSLLTTPVAETPSGVQNKTRMTFVWTSTSEAVQNQLEIRSGSTNGSVVFDQTIPAPFRDNGGRYRYTLPVLGGDSAMPEGVYYWRVMSSNPVRSSSYSAWKYFALNLADSSSSYSIAGEIAYYGAVTAPGPVVVEAFASAGFSGEPMARVRLTSPGAYELAGLPAGTYSVRAFVDQDGDGEMDDGETRGYLTADAYSIKSLSLPVSRTGQDFTLRARDTNQNGIADDWEYDRFGALIANPQFVDFDGDGLSDWDEIFIYDTDPYRFDSAGDGLSDGERVSIGLNTRKMDTDEDGYADALELALGSNPLNAASIPPTDDLFRIVSVAMGVDQDVITYDVEPAVITLFRDVDLSVSYSASLMQPFTTLGGSARSVYTTNWTTGPWIHVNAPPAGDNLFYRIDWKLKNP